jgi:uncharacterized cupin superfamily protein
MRDRPIRADSVEAKKGQTIYPEPFASLVAGRTKRKLGDVFGLRNFGVNLTTLDPGFASALAHTHKLQDEFVFILEGRLTIVVGESEYELSPGDCMGFKAGTGTAHQIINRTDHAVSYIEIGDRTPGDEVTYPHDDIAVTLGAGGSWVVTRKDGSAF